MNGWLKLHRQLLDHWIASEPESLAVWVRLLMEANHKTNKRKFNGTLTEIKRGQLIFGLNAFSEKSGVSVAKLRRILSELESDGVISRQKTNKYSLITITCFDKYQEDDRQNAGKPQANNNQITGESQAGNNQIATPKECKNDKEGKEGNKKDIVDFSVLQVSEGELSEIKRIRRKNKGGTITQRVANALAKEFNAAYSIGYSLDEILTEWEVRAWKSFKAEWLKPKSMHSNQAQQMSQAAAQTFENLKDGF